jgi:hypothetical protein
MGTTQYRNRALAVRSCSLVSVPKHEWDKVWSDEQGQQQYLTQLFGKAGMVCGHSARHNPKQRPEGLQQQQPAAPARAAARALLRKSGLTSGQDSSQQVGPVTLKTQLYQVLRTSMCTVLRTAVSCYCVDHLYGLQWQVQVALCINHKHACVGCSCGSRGMPQAHRQHGMRSRATALKCPGQVCICVQRLALNMH